MPTSTTFPYRPFTKQELKQGWALEYPLSWRDIVKYPYRIPERLANTLDTLDKLIENPCVVTIVHGKPLIGDGESENRWAAIEPWLEEAKKLGLIDHREWCLLKTYTRCYSQ